MDLLGAGQGDRGHGSGEAVRAWWNVHPMDYLGYLPPDALADTQALRSYFDKVDAGLRDQGRHLHGPRGELFGKILDPAALSGLKVLEIGCGLGAVTAQIASRTHSLVALDLSDTGTHATRARLAAFGLNGLIVQGDARSIPLPSDSIDAVWSWGVIHHSRETQRAVDEIHRVLRPGGRAVVMVYHRNSTYYWLNVMLRYGIFRLGLLHSTPQQLLNRYSDGKEHGGSPLAQYFTRGQARRLFRAFGDVSTRTVGPREGIVNLVPNVFGVRRILDRAIGDELIEAIMSRFGVHLVIYATK